MKAIDGGVTAALGFEAAGVYAGIKRKRKDMAVVYTKTPAKAAGVFTTNVVKAAPVKWDIALLKKHTPIHAVVLNSGVANACTGALGEENNKAMASVIADAFEIDENEVLTASTGVIGKQLPMEPIIKGAYELKKACEHSNEAGSLAAQAIMTTDTVAKECAATFEIDGKTVTIGGMSKGSGMIHPNMATMLAVITTDVEISAELLQEAVSADVKKSFNMISVDRDTSTNDSYMVLANGLAGNRPIVEKNADYKKFCEALSYITTTLAKKMAQDGEGANKLLEVTILNAQKYQQAVTLAKAVITSNLVKTAVFGNDANWGRILCALGYSGVKFNPETVDLFIKSSYGTLQLVKDGMATDYSEELASKILSDCAVTVTADIKAGKATATAWGCDLTYDYVKINADYRS